MTREITFADAINEALRIALTQDDKALLYGLGVDDPKRIFGTTKELKEEFGQDRVFDMPTSENAMTGVGIGLSLNGYRPIMVHQRLDFFLLAMDQLVNNAAKWRYMFGGQMSIPITIRLILGRGWGQGPTHAQNLQSWFAHIPGLKVVMPASPADAKGLLLESIFDDNPVVFLEHRWLHNQLGDVPEGDVRTPLGKGRIAKKGDKLTIVAMSYMVLEALKAANILEKHGVDCEVIDIQTASPLPEKLILDSVQKTGHLITLDTSWTSVSLSNHIVSLCTTRALKSLKSAPVMIGLPNYPVPTSYFLTRNYYRNATHIIEKVKEILNLSVEIPPEDAPQHHDIPGAWFKGPFQYLITIAPKTRTGL